MSVNLAKSALGQISEFAKFSEGAALCTGRTENGHKHTDICALSVSLGKESFLDVEKRDFSRNNFKSLVTNWE